MKLSDLQQEIAVIEQQLQGLLDEGGRQAVQQAKRDLERLAAARNGRRGKKKRKPVVPWRLTIPHGNPLRFIPTMPTVGVRHQLIVDLFCSLSEPDHGLPSGEHNIVLRLWSEDDALWFREGLDAAPLWTRSSRPAGGASCTVSTSTMRVLPNPALSFIGRSAEPNMAPNSAGFQVPSSCRDFRITLLV